MLTPSFVCLQSRQCEKWVSLSLMVLREGVVDGTAAGLKQLLRAIDCVFNGQSRSVVTGDGDFERFASWMNFPIAFASAVYFCLLYAWLKIALSVPVFLRYFLFSLRPRFGCLTRAITHIISLWSLRKSESRPECREKWRWKGRKARRNQFDWIISLS